MKRIILTLSVCALMIATSCKNDKKNDGGSTDTTEMNDSDMNDSEMNSSQSNANTDRKVQLTLDAKSGSNVSGTAVFRQEGQYVTMNAVVGGLSEGTHAIHIHEKADCSAADGTSTGGHWNPTNQPHGKWGSSEGYHKGDIGNLEANADGNATITLKTDEWCIGCGDANKDILGKAIIVHEGTDDFQTQPTGAAGGRVSCGGIIE